MKSNKIEQFIRDISTPLIGPQASSKELILGWGTAILFAAGQLLWAFVGSNWAWWQILIAVVFAFDIGGGVVVNATRSGRQYWHRPELTTRDHILFYAAHVHPFVVAFFWPEYSWLQAGFTYVGMGIFAYIVFILPAELKRPAAFGLAAIAIVAGITLLEMPAGLIWFVPMYFMKLILAHAVPEV